MKTLATLFTATGDEEVDLPLVMQDGQHQGYGYTVARTRVMWAVPGQVGHRLISPHPDEHHTEKVLVIEKV